MFKAFVFGLSSSDLPFSVLRRVSYPNFKFESTCWFSGFKLRALFSDCSCSMYTFWFLFFGFPIFKIQRVRCFVVLCSFLFVFSAFTFSIIFFRNSFLRPKVFY